MNMVIFLIDTPNLLILKSQIEKLNGKPLKKRSLLRTLETSKILQRNLPLLSKNPRLIPLLPPRNPMTLPNNPLTHPSILPPFPPLPLPIHFPPSLSLKMTLLSPPTPLIPHPHISLPLNLAPPTLLQNLPFFGSLETQQKSTESFAKSLKKLALEGSPLNITAMKQPKKT